VARQPELTPVLPPISREAHARIVRDAVLAEREACQQIALDASEQPHSKKIKGDSAAALIAMAIGARA
jgi:hypothetical protein